MPRFVPPLTQSPTQPPTQPLTPLALALTLIFTPALATPAHAQSTPTPEEPRILQPVTVSADASAAAPDPTTEDTGVRRPRAVSTGGRPSPTR